LTVNVVVEGNECTDEVRFGTVEEAEVKPHQKQEYKCERRGKEEPERERRRKQFEETDQTKPNQRRERVGHHLKKEIGGALGKSAEN